MYFEDNAMSNLDSAKPVNRSFISTMVAIAWSFIGLRRKKDFDRDVGGLNPVYVVGAALIGAAIFVAVLLAIVSLAGP